MLMRLRSFLQLQGQFWGIGTFQKFLPLNQFRWIQAIQKDPDLARRFQIWFNMETQFQTANLLIPKPHSLLGKHTFSQATLALAFSSLPFYKNLLNFCSRSRITFLGSIKILVQNIWRLKRTEVMSCNLPAKEIYLDNQGSILAVTRVLLILNKIYYLRWLNSFFFFKFFSTF